jgi:UDP-N-acetyl-D-mannosaminuronate dehydrogenase
LKHSAHLNIALMNELAIIFDRLGVATREVPEAAGIQPLPYKMVISPEAKV